MSWYEVVIYPGVAGGSTGAPYENDGTSEPTPRLLKLVDDGWLDHMRRASAATAEPGVRAAHGYDTCDCTVVTGAWAPADLRAVVDTPPERGCAFSST